MKPNLRGIASVCSIPLFSAAVVLVVIATGTAASSAPGGPLPIADANVEAREVYRVGVIAQNEVIKECMERQGFAFIPPPVRAEDDDDEVSRELFQPIEPSEVSPLPERAREPMGPGWYAYWDALSDDEQAAWEHAFVGDEAVDSVEYTLSDGSLLGVATGGCLGEAKRSVAGVDHADVEFLDAEVQIMGMAAAARAHADPALRRALGKWRSCAVVGGRTYADPSALSDDVVGDLERALSASTRGSPAQVQRLTTTVASAAAVDARCRRTADLDRVAAAALSAAEGAVADQRSDLLARWSEARARVLTGAERYIDVDTIVGR